MESKKGTQEFTSSDGNSALDRSEMEEGKELFISGTEKNVYDFTKLKGKKTIINFASFFGKPREVVIIRDSEYGRTVITAHGGYSQAESNDILLVLKEGEEENHIIVDILDDSSVEEELTSEPKELALAEAVTACNATGENEKVTFSESGESPQSVTDLSISLERNVDDFVTGSVEDAKVSASVCANQFEVNLDNNKDSGPEIVQDTTVHYSEVAGATKVGNPKPTDSNGNAAKKEEKKR